MASETKITPELIAKHGKFKQRSHDTTINTHIPELNSHPPNSPLDVVLIGDSMLERLKTSGSTTRIAQLKSSLNLGVGGDKIENVLYRLGSLGMMEKLAERKVKLWVVMIGTNNLKKTLKANEIELYRLLLRALLEISGPETKILTCDLFRRKDVADGDVDASNGLMAGVVGELNALMGEGEGRIYRAKAGFEIGDEVLDDHVHLNEGGYRLWDEVLYPRIQELLRCDG